jgi:two-component system nitrogen regulation response regulator NtrX
LRKEVQQLREHSPINQEMIGNSAVINQLRHSIEKVAPTNSRVLITGPSGCGKELTARMLHQFSHRNNGPFVALNAAAITPDRMELELFGTVDQKAAPRKVGALEEAHLGTLYIDEIADMPLETQSKILRVLVEQKFQRLGNGTKVEVDVRIVSSSSRDLEEERRNGNLREDLFHRLNVVPLEVPGLSERREDIPTLVKHFITQISVTSGLVPRAIGEDAMAILQSYEWPGNVRQLRNIVERLMILSEGDADTVITAEMLPEELGGSVNLNPEGSGGEHLMSLPLRDAREIFEREYLLAQINRFGGNISRTAEFIGMERSALHRKLRVLGVNSSDRKKEAI